MTAFEPMFALAQQLAGGGRDLLLPMYAEVLVTQLPLLCQALQAGDAQAAAAIAHKVAGSSSMLQDALLFEAVRAVETCAGQADLAGARVAMQHLGARAQATLEAITRAS